MNVMKRAWEIYRTLIGDHRAKLSMALKLAWAEKRSAKFQPIDNNVELPMFDFGF